MNLSFFKNLVHPSNAKRIYFLVIVGLFFFGFLTIEKIITANLQEGATAQTPLEVSQEINFFNTGAVNSVEALGGNNTKMLVGGGSRLSGAVAARPHLAYYKNGVAENLGEKLVGFETSMVSTVSFDRTNWLVGGGNPFLAPASSPKINIYDGENISDFSSLLTDYYGNIETASGNGTVWILGLNEPTPYVGIEGEVGKTKNSLLEFDGANITKITDSVVRPDLNGAYITDIAWNGSYWLVGYRSVPGSDPSPLHGPYKSRLLQYDGTSIKELQIAQHALYSIYSLGWNGKYWIIPVYLPIQDLTELWKYDGVSLTRLPVEIPKGETVSAISWQDNYWVLALASPAIIESGVGMSLSGYTVASHNAQLFKYHNLVLEELPLPSPFLIINGIARKSSEEFLIGGVLKTGKAGLVSYKVAAPPVYPENTLIKGEKPEVYRIIGGQRKHIPNPILFNLYGLRWEDINVIDQGTVDLVPESKLVQAPGNPKVYYIDKNQKRWLQNIEIFNSYGLGWENVFQVDAREIAAYPTARLVRLPNDEKVYYITASGMRRHIPTPQVFESYGNKWHDVVTITVEEFESYPANNLIKLEGTTKIYKVMLGKKHWVKNFDAFRRLGFRLEDVAPVNLTEFNSYPEGSPIE